jgi:hypothetical protein
MSSLNEHSVRAIALKFPKGNLEVFLDDGRVILVPINWYPRLATAPRKSLHNFEWIGKGIGIHWPELDEDLSVEGFLKAQKAPKNQFKITKPELKKAVVSERKSLLKSREKRVGIME